MARVGVTSTVVTVNVRAVTPLLDQVVALLSPIYAVHRPVPMPAMDISVVRCGKMSVDAATRSDIPRLPQLTMGPDRLRYIVVCHDPDKVVVIRDREPGRATILIKSAPQTGVMEIEVYDGSRETVQAVVRMITYVVGGLVNSMGFPAYHSSGVATNGAGVLIAGPSGSGKSTLAFLVCTEAGWDLLADDQVYVWNECPSSPPRLAGWPSCVKISVSALEGHSMRSAFESASLYWHKEPMGVLRVPDGSWGRDNRSRIYCEIDEFFTITGASGAHSAALLGVVLPEADRDVAGWHIESVPSNERIPWYKLPAIQPTLRERKHAIDFLGLLPYQRPDPVRRACLEAYVAAVPCVRVRYGPDVNKDIPRFWAEVTKQFY